jgi:hypothetical protein
VRVHEGRRDQFDLLPGQLEFVGEGGCRQHQDGGGGAQHGGSAGQHRIVPLSGCFCTDGTMHCSWQSCLRCNKLQTINRNCPRNNGPRSLQLIRIGDATLTLSDAAIVMPSPRGPGGLAPARESGPPLIVADLLRSCRRRPFDS